QRDALWPRLALREHRAPELVDRDVRVGRPHGDVEILVERHAPRFERADSLLMPILKVCRVELEVFDDLRSLLAIPRVRSEHAADVEQHQLDLRHPTSTARAGAPSRSTRRNGNTRSSYGPLGGAERSSPSTMMTPRSSSVRCVR